MKKKIQLKKEVISQLDDARLLQVKGGTAAGTNNCPESDAYGNACMMTIGGATCCGALSGCVSNKASDCMCLATKQIDKTCFDCPPGRTEPVVCATGGYTVECDSFGCPVTGITMCNSVVNCSL